MSSSNPVWLSCAAGQVGAGGGLVVGRSGQLAAAGQLERAAVGRDRDKLVPLGRGRAHAPADVQQAGEGQGAAAGLIQAAGCPKLPSLTVPVNVTVWLIA